MRDQILRILAGYPGVKAEQVGKLWQVSVGPYGGARENGISLARDLKAQYDYQQSEPGGQAPDVSAKSDEPAPIEIPAFLRDPHEAGEMQALRDQVRKMQAERDEVPEAVQEFLREGEPHGEAQARLWQLYNTLTQKLLLNVATSEETRTHTRLHGALYWVSRGAVDVV